ncbi:MAG: transposase [Geobacteraceae bacterium]|nr:transposase [Geobacteraceae bacterium]
MARPLRIAYPGAFYHVTSRGNEQKDVFKSRRDRENFLEYLASATQRYGAVIHAYCLMSNHYHLLLETPAANLSQIMQQINSAYTTYFNVKRKRAGHLFQGRYKAILVEADEYATELSRYIHLNPVRAAMAARPEDWPWSSYRGYIGQDKAPEWLKREFILGHFGKKAADAVKRYRAFVEDLLGKEYESPLKATFGTAILGSAAFIEAITAEHLTTREAERDIPALRQFAPRPALAEILSAVKSVIDSDEKLARQAGMYLCHRYSGEKLRAIGELFNVRESAISEASRLFPRKMEKDEKLGDVIDRIKGILGIWSL